MNILTKLYYRKLSFFSIILIWEDICLYGNANLHKNKAVLVNKNVFYSYCNTYYGHESWIIFHQNVPKMHYSSAQVRELTQFSIMLIFWPVSLWNHNDFHTCKVDHEACYTPCFGLTVWSIWATPLHTKFVNRIKRMNYRIFEYFCITYFLAKITIGKWFFSLIQIFPICRALNGDLSLCFFFPESVFSNFKEILNSANIQPMQTFSFNFIYWKGSIYILSVAVLRKTHPLDLRSVCCQSGCQSSCAVLFVVKECNFLPEHGSEHLVSQSWRQVFSWYAE